MTYHYLVDGSGNLLRNRLYHVNDAIAGAAYTGDLEDQGDFNFEDINGYNEYIVENDNNYRYDEEGRLIQDLAEGIESIVWRVDGKVKKVIFTSGSGKNNLEFDYDAFGRLIAKHVLTQGNVLVKSTYYILDAQGNQLSVYEHIPESETPYELTERVIYGSARIGSQVQKIDLLDTEPEELLSLTLGEKHYFMSNHLGNILTVINDIKVPYLIGTDVAYYATIVSTADYSPFGVQLDVRTTENQAKWGFQGQETDNEIKGEGNSVNYTYRMHDPRLGRFFAVDPLARDYPHNSPYAFSENRLLDGVELEGLEFSGFVDRAKQAASSGGAASGGSAPKTSTPAPTKPTVQQMWAAGAANAQAASGNTQATSAPAPTQSQPTVQQMWAAGAANAQTTSGGTSSNGRSAPANSTSSLTTNINHRNAPNSSPVGVAEELNTVYNNGTWHIYTHSGAFLADADAAMTPQGAYAYVYALMSTNTIGVQYNGDNVSGDASATLSLFSLGAIGQTSSEYKSKPALGHNASIEASAAVVQGSVNGTVTTGNLSVSAELSSCAACIGVDGTYNWGYDPNSGSYFLGVGGGLAYISGGHLSFFIVFKP